MMADRKEFSDAIQARHTEKRTALLPVAQIVQGAAVVADKLQRTEEWGRYCTYLQGFSEKMAHRKQVAQHKLGDPSIVDDHQIRKLRQDIFIADVTIDTLKFAVELPAYILKGGEEADRFIEQFEKKNETTGQANSQGGTR